MKKEKGNNRDGCKNENEELNSKILRKLSGRMAEIKGKGFELKEAKVNFILFRKDEDNNIEVKIIQPELYFEK